MPRPLRAAAYAGYHFDQAMKPMLYQASALVGSAAVRVSNHFCASSHFFWFNDREPREARATVFLESMFRTRRNWSVANVTMASFSGLCAPGMYCCM
jgi:hypothetical protein